MTLSSFLLRPAKTAIITDAGTFNITSSPAIVTGIFGSSVAFDVDYSVSINSGATNVFLTPRFGANYNYDSTQFTTGLDCPNGISLTTVKNSGSGSTTNIRLNVFYILK